MDEKVILDDKVDVYRRQQKILVVIMAVVIVICIAVVVVVPAVVLTRSSDSGNGGNGGNGNNVDSTGSAPSPPPPVNTGHKLHRELMLSSPKIQIANNPTTTGWTKILQRVYNQNSGAWNGLMLNGSIFTGAESDTGDYWIGLPYVYDLLSDDEQTYSLRIDVQLASDGNWYSYTYPTFRIGNSTTQYALYVSDGGSWSPSSNSLLSDGPLTSKIPEYSSNNQPFQTTVSFEHVVYATRTCISESKSAYSYLQLHSKVEPSTKRPNKKFDCVIANGGGGWWFSNCYYYCATCNQALCNGCGGFPIWLATRMMIKVNNNS